MESSIEKIWQLIHNDIKLLISKKIKEPADIEDIIQDTFLKMNLNIGKLKEPSKINAWIFQIARNNINDYYRAKNRHSEQESNGFVSSELMEEGEDEVKTSKQTRHFSEYAASLINQLPEKYRKAVYLSDIEGLGQSEIAEKLGLSVSGTKSRIQRGRQKVKELILLCCAINADIYGNIIDYFPKEENCKKKC